MLMIAIAGFLLAGCAVGPDFHRPPAPVIDGYTQDPLLAQAVAAGDRNPESQYLKPGLDIPAQWWTLFHSQALNSLIEQALRNNPDLKAAQAALRVAQENVRAQQGAYYPDISAGFSSDRQKTPTASLTTNAASGASIYSLHTPQVSVAYAPDIFGATRRAVESLQAQADYQRFELEAAYLTLTSNIVVSAIQEASLGMQISLTQDMIRLQTEQLDLIRRQYELGAIAESGVVAQEAALAQTQSLLPALEKALAQQRDLLAALVGRFSGEGVAEKFELSSLQLPQELPVSLPARLIEERPDILAAESQLHAASAQIGIAAANRLPDITLSADYGSTATAISRLFSSGTGFWSAAIGLTQPVFQGGTLLHRQRATEAAYEQAAAQYRSTVIAAFQNVADTLHAIQYDAAALQAATASERASARNLDIARGQMEAGAISYLSLLNAQQAYQQAQISLAQTRATRYADTAALFQALGGGWWNRGSDNPSESDRNTAN